MNGKQQVENASFFFRFVYIFGETRSTAVGKMFSHTVSLRIFIVFRFWKHFQSSDSRQGSFIGRSQTSKFTWDFFLECAEQLTQ